MIRSENVVLNTCLPPHSLNGSEWKGIIRNDPHGPLLVFNLLSSFSMCDLTLSFATRQLQQTPSPVGHTNCDNVLHHYYPSWCMPQLNPATFSVQRGRLISSQIKYWPHVLPGMSESLFYFNKHWKASLLFCSWPSSVILHYMHGPNMAVHRGKEMASLGKGEDGGRKETYGKV